MDELPVYTTPNHLRPKMDMFFQKPFFKSSLLLNGFCCIQVCLPNSSCVICVPFCINPSSIILMYSAHLSLRASVPNRHDRQFNAQPNDQRRGSHTKKRIPVMPRTKPEGETQAGSQPMRRGLGRRDYSSIKTAGARTGIPDHSCPPLLPLPPPPPLCTEPWVASKLTPGPGKGERGRRGEGGEASPG